MPYSDLVTQKEAAAILNRSVSAVSRAIKDGRLEYADPKNRLLHRPGLEMRFRRKTSRGLEAATQNAKRTDAASGESPPIATDYWSRLDQKLSSCAALYWQQPSDPQRLRLFCRTLDELRNQCEMEVWSLSSQLGRELGDGAFIPAASALCSRLVHPAGHFAS